MTELTVVMSVYNGEPYLISAIESLQRQSIQDFEILIVDDGSTDRSSVILGHYARRDSRISVIRQENAGQTAALNKACGLVRTPYIARMDADDISAPDRFRRQLDFLNRDPEVALLGGAAEYVNESGDVLFTVEVPTTDEEIRARLPSLNAFVHSAVVMRRDAVLAVGGYRRAFLYADDYDLWLRLAERHKVANLAATLVSYRVHREQVSTKGLEQQVLSAMGARLSAKMRQARGRDLFDSMGLVTREELCRFGITHGEIEEEIVKASANWAGVMRDAGYHDGAVVLAKEAWRRGRGRVLTRKRLAQFYVEYARASVLKGHLLDGAIQAARAMSLHPSLLVRLVHKGVGKAIERWRRLYG